MDNEQLYEHAKQAIRDLYTDTSVSQEETANSLRAIISECEDLLATLDA